MLAPNGEGDGARQPAPEDITALTAGWGVQRVYWPVLETPFRRMVEALPDSPDGALAEWRRTVSRTAKAALDRLVNSLDTTPRSLKAGVRASDRLAYALTHFEETGEVLEPRYIKGKRGDRP